MENPIVDPVSAGATTAFIVKFKVYIAAGGMAVLSSAYKYRKDKRQGKKSKTKNFLSYLSVTSIVVFLALGLMIRAGFEIDLLGYMVMFLCGQSADYIMDLFDRMLKAKGEKEIKKIEND